MRIKFKCSASDLPVLEEVRTVYGSVKDDRFIISFDRFESNAEYPKMSLCREIHCGEDLDRAIQTFGSIQTSLGLNGYANLVPDDNTSLIDSKWFWS